MLLSKFFTFKTQPTEIRAVHMKDRMKQTIFYTKISYNNYMNVSVNFQNIYYSINNI